MLPEGPLVNPRSPADGRTDNPPARHPDPEARLDQEVEQHAEAYRAPDRHDRGPRFPDTAEDRWCPGRVECRLWFRYNDLSPAMTLRTCLDCCGRPATFLLPELRLPPLRPARPGQPLRLRPLRPRRPVPP